MLTVGIAGGTGSGKTTLVKRLTEALHNIEIVIIPQDAYYKDNSHIPPGKRQNINFDHPDSVDFGLLTGHLKQLGNGNAVAMPVYSYLTCLRSLETIALNPPRVVIVEGILILADEDLRNMLDIKVFVDADADDRLGRVIKRDTAERGRSIDDVLERYNATVKPSHLQFIEPTKRFADLIIPGGGENQIGINVLISVIENYLLINKS